MDNWLKGQSDQNTTVNHMHNTLEMCPGSARPWALHNFFFIRPLLSGTEDITAIIIAKLKQE